MFDNEFYSFVSCGMFVGIYSMLNSYMVFKMTRRDWIRNDNIREQVGVAPILER